MTSLGELSDLDQLFGQAEDHYCSTDTDLLPIPSHPLNHISDIDLEIFEVFGVFRCQVCFDWWGLWLRRDQTSEESVWRRYGSHADNVFRHR